MRSVVLMKRLLLALVCLAMPALAQAQATTFFTVVITPAGGTPITTVIAASNFVCGQPVLMGTTINPRHIEFTDPSNAALVCLFTDNGTNGPLSSLPFGSTTYTATLSATNAVGTSPVSAPSNSFTQPGLPPAVLTGLQIVR